MIQVHSLNFSGFGVIPRETPCHEGPKDCQNESMKAFSLGGLLVSGLKAKVLGGPWDLGTTHNWDYNPTYNRGNPLRSI